MQPFLPALLPKPEQYIDYNDHVLTAALGEANRALARYDASLARSPCADLLLGSLTDREATLSSRIEGTQSTFSEVLHFKENENIASDEQRDELSEIRNYVEALNFGADALTTRQRRFSLSLLKELHAILLGRGSVRGKDKQPGAFRSGPVRIGGVNVSQATYVPPEVMHLTDLMENWERYWVMDAPDPLVQTAILHAQFELIHPFMDGNGRLGRLLIPFFLLHKGVLDRPNFYLSAYLERHRDAYMDALKLLNTTPGEWHRWVLFFLRAITKQAKQTTGVIDDVDVLYKKRKFEFRDMGSSFASLLLDAIFANPIFSLARIKAEFAKAGSSPTASTLFKLLNKLVQSGVLEILQAKSGSRGAVYKFTELVRLLEAEGE